MKDRVLRMGIVSDMTGAAGDKLASSAYGSAFNVPFVRCSLWVSRRCFRRFAGLEGSTARQGLRPAIS